MLTFSCLMTSYGCGNMIRLLITDHFCLRGFPPTMIITRLLAIMSLGFCHITHSHVLTVAVIQEA